ECEENVFFWGCKGRCARGVRPGNLNPPAAERANPNSDGVGTRSGNPAPACTGDREALSVFPGVVDFSRRRITQSTEAGFSRAGDRGTEVPSIPSPRLHPPSAWKGVAGRVRDASHRARAINDPSAGSPTETLLRLLLPLDNQV